MTEPRSQENVQLRIRGLALAEAVRLARSGSMQERMILERTFGKLVWESLLQNPSLTVPEVARIAGNGTVAQPLLDQIVANPAWVKSEEVRKRLLGNPRLRGQTLLKVLRAASKADLVAIAQQASLPHSVREAARRMIPK